MQVRAETAVDKLVALAGDVSACPTIEDFRRLALETFDTVAPFDSALFLPLGPRGQVTGAPTSLRAPGVERYRLYAASPERYRPWAVRSLIIATARRGAYADNQAFSRAERERLPFYVDIVNPQGISKQVVAHLTFRGGITASVHLRRHGRASDFGDRELDRVRSLLPAIALVQASFAQAVRLAAPVPAEKTEPLGEHLSARERQVVALVARGLQNKEIALAIGTSPNTVRNQLAQIFDKTGASSRTELAVWAAAAGSSPQRDVSCVGVLAATSRAPGGQSGRVRVSRGSR
jgi:DNA-binding CsgD family transcriptional regulator